MEAHDTSASRQHQDSNTEACGSRGAWRPRATRNHVWGGYGNVTARTWAHVIVSGTRTIAKLLPAMHWKAVLPPSSSDAVSSAVQASPWVFKQPTTWPLEEREI